jgi:hypothetical protein
MALLMIAGGCLIASAQKCLKYGPTAVSLTGTLRSQVFPGPPNYESIKRGDRKETAIILTLVAPTCTAGNDPQGVEVTEMGVREMQLVVTKTAHWKIIRRRMGKRVVVTGTLFHAVTGHHHKRFLSILPTFMAPHIPARSMRHVGDGSAIESNQFNRQCQRHGEISM